MLPVRSSARETASEIRLTRREEHDKIVRRETGRAISRVSAEALTTEEWNGRFNRRRFADEVNQKREPRQVSVAK